jgi:hypothetical protein
MLTVLTTILHYFENILNFINWGLFVIISIVPSVDLLHCLIGQYNPKYSNELNTYNKITCMVALL